MQTANATADFRTLAIDQLRESPTNPRRTFDEAKLQEHMHIYPSVTDISPCALREGLTAISTS